MTALRTRPAPARPLAPAAPPPAPAAPAKGHDCHYCDAVLPRGRALTFGPPCGENLTTRQCPACSAEVDVGWKFCVCCGRGGGG